MKGIWKEGAVALGVALLLLGFAAIASKPVYCSELSGIEGATKLCTQFQWETGTKRYWTE